MQRQAGAEFAAERALVDEVVARIQQEDRMELAARRAKQADTKVSHIMIMAAGLPAYSSSGRIQASHTMRRLVAAVLRQLAICDLQDVDAQMHRQAY